MPGLALSWDLEADSLQTTSLWTLVAKGSTSSVSKLFFATVWYGMDEDHHRLFCRQLALT